MMHITTLRRQFATGFAAFFLTALLVLANAPVDGNETALHLVRSGLGGA